MFVLLRRCVDLYERSVVTNEAFLALRLREAAAREREVDSAIRRDAVDVDTALSWKPAASQVSRDVTEIKARLASLTGSASDGKTRHGNDGVRK